MTIRIPFSLSRLHQKASIDMCASSSTWTTCSFSRQNIWIVGVARRRAWDERVLAQLSTKYKEKFCAVRTRKYAFHKPVLGLLYARRKGITPTGLLQRLKENHRKRWTRQCLAYLTACQRHAAKSNNTALYESPDPVSPLTGAA